MAGAAGCVAVAAGSDRAEHGNPELQAGHDGVVHLGAVVGDAQGHHGGKPRRAAAAQGTKGQGFRLITAMMAEQ